MLTRATPWGMVMKQGAGVPYMDSRSKTGMANVNDSAFQELADKMGTSNSDEYADLVAEYSVIMQKMYLQFQCIGTNLYKHTTATFMILPLTVPLDC